MVQHLSIPLEEARDYSNDGCWETLVFGRTEFSYGHIELLLSLESVLNRGESFNTGHTIGLELGDPAAFTSYEEFYGAFKTDMLRRIDNAIRNKLEYYGKTFTIAPTPFLSALIDDCLEKGRDLTNGGARYRFFSPLATGLAHCADSLAVVKKLIYEDKTVAMDRLLDALRNNWEGEERLRQTCLNRVPKYGNDDEYADGIVKRILADFCGHIEAWQQRVDWIKFPAGIGTFENYPRLGYHVGPTPDGRFAREALSSNYSPAVGRDKNGPTAVLRSSAKFDLKRMNDGCPVDLRVNLGDRGEGGTDILSGFIKSFLRLGGNILTITQVSTETLRAAQAEPEKYASLRVRLGGLTAYFVQLATPQQEEYIRRTEHGF